MDEKPVRIALTIGDPAGIGPELAASVLAGGAPEGISLYLIGSVPSLKRCLPGRTSEGIETATAREALDRGFEAPFPLAVDVAGGIEAGRGGPSAGGGIVSGRAVELAVDLFKEGLVEGIVTGPVSKEALRMGGYPYNGHTSMLADLFAAPRCEMMMVSDDLRILVLTRDIPLREVPAAVTRERIVDGAAAADRAVREFWDIGSPRILVAALNPHAGDGGVNGMEEIEVIGPAIDELRAGGVDAVGPVPADTLFYRWRDLGGDAIVALYHDQGMIPFKAGGFDRGVNMTIGLPVVRTSVCHGTAYDIAGSGKAEPGSLRAALELAGRCCRVRRKKSMV